MEDHMSSRASRAATRDHSLAAGEVLPVDRRGAAEALRADLCAFEDLINQPLSRDRDEAPQVRDYRHAIYPQFEKLAESVLSLSASLELTKTALGELATVVRGECPSLLDEDSGGSARLSGLIDDALQPSSGDSR